MIRRGPAGGRRAAARRLGAAHPHPDRHRLPASGSGRRRSSRCCPSTSATWAAPTPLAGLVMASFFAAGVLFQYPVGRLADRIGRKPVLVAGLVVYAAASFAFLAPIAPAMAILLRGLQGLGAGASAVAALAMVSGARGRRAARPGLRLHLRRPDLRHGRRSPDRGHRRRPPHVDHVPRLGRGGPGGLHPRPAHRRAGRGDGACAEARTNADGTVAPLGPGAAGTGRWPAPWWPPPPSASPPASTTSAGRCCWCPGAPPAGRSASRGRCSPCPSWSPPARAAGWPTTWTVATWCSAAWAWPWCSAPATRSSTWCPLLMILGGTEALGFAAAMPVAPVAAHPGVRAVRGRPHPGHVRHAPRPPAPRCRRPLAGAAFAVARWLPVPVGRRRSPRWPWSPRPSSGGKVPGHVHPELQPVEVDAAPDVRPPAGRAPGDRPGGRGRSGGGGRQLRGAVGAPGGRVRHLGQALGALPHRLLVRGAAQLAHQVRSPA